MNRITRRSVLATGAALAVSGDPAEAASSERRLVGMLGQRCRMLAQTSGFSGAVVLIHDQRELYAESFGHRNRSEGLANRIDTRFNIASIGKLFTSLSIMRLVEAGRLRLDAPLIEAWPSYLDKVVVNRP
jgi:D-alanyl-D-alanine carboxypeptidase